MQILIGCAKDMSESPSIQTPWLSLPRFADEAASLAKDMAQYDETELQDMLHISSPLAHTVKRRYMRFVDSDNAPQAAIAAYNGVVFRNMSLDDFSQADFDYAQRHLWITSFLYGLLRPLDGIKSYRLEGNVVLPETGVSMFRYWSPRLTGLLIDSVKADDGILVDLASGEMRHLFDWRKVEKELRVVRPEFLVYKNGTMKALSVYAKKCRGAMTSWILRDRITDPAQLSAFTYQGFSYRGDNTSADNPVFVLDA